MTQIEIRNGLKKRCQQCNRKKTVDKEGKIKYPHFTFFKTSASEDSTDPASTAETHLQANACEDIAILPTHLIYNRTKNISWN